MILEERAQAAPVEAQQRAGTAQELAPDAPPERAVPVAEPKPRRPRGFAAMDRKLVSEESLAKAVELPIRRGRRTSSRPRKHEMPDAKGVVQAMRDAAVSRPWRARAKTSDQRPRLARGVRS